MVLRKSNNWDSPADVLRAEHRQKQLQHRERKKRSYQKKQVVYWSEGIRNVRNNKVFVSKQFQVQQEDVPSTTAEKENNVNTVSNEQVTQPQQIRKRKNKSNGGNKRKRKV